MSRTQGHVLLMLLTILVALVGFEVLQPAASPPDWEYRIVAWDAEGHDREGTSAMRYASIQIDTTELAQLGSEGWELVDTMLEMETAWPNFGNDRYVAGLQPNIRPQRALLLFRRARHGAQRARVS